MTVSALTFQIDRQLARITSTTARWQNGSYRFGLIRKLFQAVDYAARAVYHLWRNHRYLTCYKLFNMALVNIQFMLKTERVIGRPYRMKIESTNICNTKCRLCPTGQGLVSRPKGKMEFDRYKQLIDRFKHHIVALDLSMWGDPLIVPDIYDMIRYAVDSGLWTYISSNLHAYKLESKRGEKSHAERLVHSGLELLTCSLHGASQDTYAIYQPGKDFHSTVDKIRQIIDTRKRLGSRTPCIQLNFVVTRHNEHEQDAFRRLADELGCKAVFSIPAMNVRFQNRNQQLQQLNLAPDILAEKTREHLDHWLPNQNEFRLSVYDRMRNQSYNEQDYNGRKEYFCDWPWRQAVINWDGQVSLCCGSYETSEDMGNAFEQDFGRIWNGRKYRLARRSFKKPINESEIEGIACASCPGFMV